VSGAAHPPFDRLSCNVFQRVPVERALAATDAHASVTRLLHEIFRKPITIRQPVHSLETRISGMFASRRRVVAVRVDVREEMSLDHVVAVRTRDAREPVVPAHRAAVRVEPACVDQIEDTTFQPDSLNVRRVVPLADQRDGDRQQNQRKTRREALHAKSLIERLGNRELLGNGCSAVGHGQRGAAGRDAGHDSRLRDRCGRRVRNRPRREAGDVLDLTGARQHDACRVLSRGPDDRRCTGDGQRCDCRRRQRRRISACGGKRSDDRNGEADDAGCSHAISSTDVLIKFPDDSDN